MEAFVKIIVLAVIQGVTEFLPVSSSGHLALGKHWMQLDATGATLELFLHGGTLLSIAVFYRRRLVALLAGLVRAERPSVLYAAWILLSMIPAGLMYLGFGDAFEAAYDSPRFVGAMLCVTGVILLVMRGVDARPGKAIGGRGACLMGVAQAVAMLPGISRSGSTIAVARFAGVSRDEAAAFSLIMSMPVIFGAVLIKVVRLGSLDFSLPVSACLVGAAVAFGVGLGAISLLVRVLNAGWFWLFGVYCITLGVVTLIVV